MNKIKIIQVNIGEATNALVDYVQLVEKKSDQESIYSNDCQAKLVRKQNQNSIIIRGQLAPSTLTSMRH